MRERIKKAIELRLGQRVRAGEVLRVLRGDDEERLGQHQGLAVERDLAFVHGLEQGRLGAGAGAVDLVGEEHVREDGPLPQHEGAGALVVDRDAEHVAREEVACKLHAFQVAANGFGHGARERGLADTRDVLDQQVSASEQGDESELDDLGLALESVLDHLPQLVQGRKLQGAEPGHRSSHGEEDSMRRWTGLSSCPWVRIRRPGCSRSRRSHRSASLANASAPCHAGLRWFWWLRSA